MARTKIGGSRSFLSGKIGSTVFQRTKDGKGLKQQRIGALAETRKLGLSPALAKQRMLMSFLMRHRSVLKHIVNQTFEGYGIGQPCLQQFMRYNLGVYQKYVESHSGYTYQTFYPEYGDERTLPAMVWISRGSLEAIVFENFGFYIGNGLRYFGCYLAWVENDTTVGEFMKSQNFYPGDTVIITAVYGQQGMGVTSVKVGKFRWKSGIDQDALMFDYDASDLFEAEGFGDYTLKWENDRKYSGDDIWFHYNPDPANDYVVSYCWFQKGVRDGIMRYSNSRLGVRTTISWWTEDKLSYQEAFPSWYDDRLSHLQSQTPIDDFPYKFVQYLEGTGAAAIQTTYNVNLSECDIEFGIGLNGSYAAGYFASSNVYGGVRAVIYGSGSTRRLRAVYFDSGGNQRMVTSSVNLQEDIKAAKIYIRNNRIYVYYNGYTSYTSITSPVTSPVSVLPLLFYDNSARTYQRIQYYRIRRVSDGALLYDLNACVRLEDEMPGFWERVGGTFLTNGTDPSAFNVGPDL